MSHQRTYILGGEIARRSWLGLSQPVMASWAISILVAIALYVLAGTSIATLVGIIVGLGAVFAATMEWGGNRSFAATRLHAVRTWDRRRRGEHIYRHRADPAFGRPDRDPGWEFPVALGNTAPLDVSGTGLDEMFILRHANPGERTYFSVVLAVDGVASGLRGDTAYAATSAAFGAFLANLAKPSSFIRGIQIVHRSVPHDMAPHERWAETQVGALTDQRLLPAVASYGALLDVLTPLAEEHRTYVCLRFPQTETFMAETARIARTKNATIHGAIAQLIRDETERATRLLAIAGMGRVEVYGERRACAVLRACIDPGYRLARHGDADWSNCWPTYIGGRDSVAIAPDGRWRTRVGTIPARAIEPAPLGPLWLAPLLTGVDADPGDDDTAPMPTIRTVSVRLDFVPAARARAAARGDFTADEARKLKERQKGKIDDGSSDVLLSASDRRRSDLTPGSGHHGVIYSLAVAVTGRDEEDLERACLRVGEAAGESAISDIDWATDDHDIALFATLPLGRGLAATSYTR
ncbi:SCO6880 family protein [Nocardia takedensis]|uniref:SCO6880 family protein n=1 Tax=Nocardia takedensis TaxID=259390 RepID=UPI0003011F53|nr:SCO6880 family protein [Nocardia takedensis]